MSYAGDVQPAEAWEALATDPGAVLVDVRTDPEIVFVGTPDLATIGKQVVTIQWTGYPHGQRNANFLDDLAGAGVGPEHPVYFLCRSGARSAAAATAATAAGWEKAYNVAEGFEGHPDEHGHRGVVGWKAAGLPWRQD